MSDEHHLNHGGLHRRVVAGIHARGDIPGFPNVAPTSNPFNNPGDSAGGKSSSSAPTTSQATSSSSSSSSSASKSSATSSSSSSSSLSSSSSSSSSTSSSSSASSSSSTSSSQSSSSSSSSKPAAPTVPTPTPTPTPSPTSSTHIVTNFVTSSGASTSSTPSPSVSSAPTSTTSTGAVVGGIAAGIVGVAGVLFAVLYFWRRSHRSDEPFEDFNAHAFRRQSVVLPDDDGLSRGPSFNRGGGHNSFSALQPSMMDQSMGIPVSYGTNQGYGMQDGYNGYNYSAQQPFAPGQYMSMGAGQGMPGTPNSANPFLTPYSQSPIGSPVTTSYGPAYDAYGRPIARSPSNGAAQQFSRRPFAAQPNPGFDVPDQPVTRQPSNGATQYLTRKQSTGLPSSPADAHYVDLARSSVTPFQAAQYAEISRRLNASTPNGLDSNDAITEETDDQLSAPEYDASTRPPSITLNEKGLPPPPPKESPFSDLTEDGQTVEHDMPRSSASEAFPALPSPAFPTHERVASIPPILPEILQRPFSPVEYPSAPAQSSAKSSPLSAVALPSQPPAAHLSNTAPASQPASPTAATAKDVPPATMRHIEGPTPKRPDTVYTLYDEEDAYGGI